MQCNRLNTSPLHRGIASNRNSPTQVKWRMQWEAPSKPLAIDDPLLLLERDLILVAFITGNSSLEPLIEGLYAQIHVNLR